MPSRKCKKCLDESAKQCKKLFLHVWKPTYPELLSFPSPFKIITNEHSKKTRFQQPHYKGNLPSQDQIFSKENVVLCFL